MAVTGLSHATAHRLAVALEAHRLLRRGADGRFLVGFGVLALAEAAQEPLALSAAAALEELRARTEESVQLYVREGQTRVCVASLESPHGLRTIVPTGATLPLAVGSGGKVLAGLPEVLRRGWAESVAEREPGVASVSAPVMRSGRVVAAVGVSGPIERLTRRPGAVYAGAVMDAARAIERAAGLDPPTRSGPERGPGRQRDRGQNVWV